MKTVEFKPGDVVMCKVSKEIFVINDIVAAVVYNVQNEQSISLQSMIDGRVFKFQVSDRALAKVIVLIHREQNGE